MKCINCGSTRVARLGTSANLDHYRCRECWHGYAMQEPRWFFENGVNYTHDLTLEADRLCYRWEHVPSATKGTRYIWLNGGQPALELLLARWNEKGRGTWKYELR